jgi:hypothetical protein
MTVIDKLSNTQRITASVTGNKVLLSKEYRKRQGDNWIVGKGITLTKENLRNLLNEPEIFGGAL